MSSAPASLTVPPPAGDVATTLRRNIDLLRRRREEEDAEAPLSERVARVITDFAGSMVFVLIHLCLFGGWIAINLGLVPGAPRFDPSLVVLAMAASVEAIFLSTFVLISQNRNAAADARRAELDLQINLLAEHEVTRLIGLVTDIARQVGAAEADPEVEELKRDVAVDAVLDHIAASDAAGEKS